MTLMQLNKNRNLTFWSLHALGWSAYAISQYLGALLYGKAVAYNKVIAIAAVSGFLLSSWLRYLCRWLWNKPPAVMIGIGILSAYATALLWRPPIYWAYHTYFDHEWMGEETHWFDYFGGALSATYLMVCWIGLYFGFRYYESMQAQREAALRSSALAQEAQLKMLRYQLNPHFLFNTLNAISTLVLDGQNRTANLAVSRLSEFLRYTLDQDPMKKVTLRQELDALNLYLGIEKLRFGDRLRLEFDVDERAESALVPSLLLQPLVENAMKYAISPREEGGSVTILAGIEGRDLRLAVSDDGPGLPAAAPPGNGRGVGLRNTRERLKVLYGDAHRIDVADAKPGLRVEMRVPLEV